MSLLRGEVEFRRGLGLSCEGEAEASSSCFRVGVGEVWLYLFLFMNSAFLDSLLAALGFGLGGVELTE
jgi:hypothetical protein